MAVAVVQSAAAAARAVRPARVFVTFALAILTCPAPGTVLGATLSTAVRCKWTTVALVAHASAVAASAMGAAAILAGSSACIPSIAIVALAHTNIIAFTMTIAVSVTGTQPGLACVTSIAFHAFAHVIDTLSNWERTVLLAVGNLTAQATVARLAKALAV